MPHMKIALCINRSCIVAFQFVKRLPRAASTAGLAGGPGGVSGGCGVPGRVPGKGVFRGSWCFCGPQLGTSAASDYWFVEAVWAGPTGRGAGVCGNFCFGPLILDAARLETERFSYGHSIACHKWVQRLLGPYPHISASCSTRPSLSHEPAQTGGLQDGGGFRQAALGIQS